MSEYVMVYGTLMRGCANHAFLKSSKFMTTAVTVDAYCMTVGCVPFVSARTPQSHINGEVYKVDRKTLTKLDRLEGHPRWYERKKTTVMDNQGNEFEAWLYFNERECGQTLVPNGCYRTHIRRRFK